MDFLKLWKEERARFHSTDGQDYDEYSSKDDISTSNIDNCGKDPEIESFPAFEHNVIHRCAYAALNSNEDCFHGLKLESFEVGKLPNVYYIPDFINHDVEACMLDQIYCSAAKWVNLRGRRLQCYGASPENPDAMLPPFLAQLADVLVSCHIFPTDKMIPNHALLNEYRPGEGIVLHTDGPCYEPIVACLSLGSSAIFEFVEKLHTDEIHVDRQPRRLARLLLRPQSLVVFKGDAYTKAMHTVPAAFSDIIDDDVSNVEQARIKVGEKLDRTTRVSITMRRWILTR